MEKKRVHSKGRLFIVIVAVIFLSMMSQRLGKAAQEFPKEMTGKNIVLVRQESDFLRKQGLVFVKGGCFEMGNIFGSGRSYEKPVHEVCVDGFYMGKYEVTVGEFKAFARETGYKTDAEKEGGCLYWMGRGWRKDRTVIWNRPGFSQTDRNPVTCVSWNDASAYLTWKREKTGLHYRLPTEAEWEYAARSGGKRESLAGTGNTLEVDGYAWFRKNSEGRPHPVGQKKPNGLGLYDMSGNVWEWVSDRYHADYYQRSPRKNPKGPVSGKGHVMRGGSWYVIPKGIQTVHRNWTHSYKRYNSLGFRLSL